MIRRKRFMEQTGGNFGAIYIFSGGALLLWAFIPVFLETLIAGTVLKINGHKKKKRGLRIAGNILLIVSGLIVLAFICYVAYGAWVLNK